MDDGRGHWRCLFTIYDFREFARYARVGKAPEGAEWDWTKAQLLPEGRNVDGAAVSQDGMA